MAMQCNAESFSFPDVTFANSKKHPCTRHNGHERGYDKTDAFCGVASEKIIEGFDVNSLSLAQISAVPPRKSGRFHRLLKHANSLHILRHLQFLRRFIGSDHNAR